MASPLKLFPTTTMVAMLNTQAKPEPRQRLLDYVTKRDGQFKVAFKFLSPTSPASAYGVTFHELIHALEFSLSELVESGLVPSWIECVHLGISLDHVIVSRKEIALYERCNMHVLRKYFTEAFDKNRDIAPLKMNTRAFMKYASVLRPEDFAVMGLQAKDINTWLATKQAFIKEDDQRTIKAMLANAPKEEWLLIGLAYETLTDLATYDLNRLPSSNLIGKPLPRK